MIFIEQSTVRTSKPPELLEIYLAFSPEDLARNKLSDPDSCSCITSALR